LIHLQKTTVRSVKFEPLAATVIAKATVIVVVAIAPIVRAAAAPMTATSATVTALIMTITQRVSQKEPQTKQRKADMNVIFTTTMVATVVAAIIPSMALKSAMAPPFAAVTSPFAPAHFRDAAICVLTRYSPAVDRQLADHRGLGGRKRSGTAEH